MEGKPPSNEFPTRRASSSDVDRWLGGDQIPLGMDTDERNGWTWHGATSSSGFHQLHSHLEEMPVTPTACGSIQELFEPQSQAAVSSRETVLSSETGYSRTKLELSEPSIPTQLQSQQTNGIIPGLTKQKARRTSSPLISLSSSKSKSPASGSIGSSPPAKLKSDNWEWYTSRYPKRDTSKGASAGKSSHVNEPLSDGNSQRSSGQENGDIDKRTSASGGGGPTTDRSDNHQTDRRNEKSGGGLKKIVRKFF